MLETGATAGATLIPIVMNAQTIAAKADKICVRAYCVMIISFFRTGPFRLCKVYCTARAKNEKYMYFSALCEKNVVYGIALFSYISKFH